MSDKESDAAEPNAEKLPRPSAGISWEKYFGKRDLTDPVVVETLSKQSFAVLYAAMKGKKVAPNVQKAAEFFAGRFVAEKVNPNPVKELTAAIIEEAKRRAGLLPPKEVLTLEAKVVTKGSDPKSS